MADFAHIARAQGHGVDSVLLSGHAWVNGEKQGTTDVVTPSNWKDIDQHMCDTFYETYKDRLAGYDAFMVGYPPAFAGLFERFNKPVICVVCTRYDYPCEGRRDWLNRTLERMQANRQLIPVCNNKYDLAYLNEHLPSTSWDHIPSLCGYVKHLWQRKYEAKWRPWSRPMMRLPLDNADNEFTICQPYERYSTCNAGGVIHIPYNASIMSAFEHWAMAIPMIVPTPRLLLEWRDAGTPVLGELRFPNSLPVKDEWLNLSDWYDAHNMPYVEQFDSMKEAADLMHDPDKDRRFTMQMNQRAFKSKTVRVYRQWSEIFKDIAARAGCTVAA